jgi:uncharacterized protein (TIGR03118 family)
VRAGRLLAIGLVAVGAAGAGIATADRPEGFPDGFVVTRLATDARDAKLVNAWGLAASPTGPWWISSEARSASTLYAGNGRKQALTVTVEGGPTGIVYSGSRGFVVRSGGSAGPARFIHACEDGTIRGWSPTVPNGWSTEAVVAVDGGAKGTIFRGIALGAHRLYATDFHNDRVLVFDERWRPVVLRGAFVDPKIPTWYAPFGITVADAHVFVTYASPAPVNGNDAPTGGYVDEFDLDGRLVSRVAQMGELNEPWGLALAPSGKLLVANFGSGRINSYVRQAGGWAFAGQLSRRDGKPIAISGLWGIAFGNGAMAGPKDTLFFAAGPHRWRGSTEVGVHGLLGSISR